MSTWDGVERRRTPAWAEVAALRAEVAELRDLLRWRYTTDNPAAPLNEWLLGIWPHDPPVVCCRKRADDGDQWWTPGQTTLSASWTDEPPTWWRPLGPLPEQGEAE